MAQRPKKKTTSRPARTPGARRKEAPRKAVKKAAPKASKKASKKAPRKAVKKAPPKASKKKAPRKAVKKAPSKTSKKAPRKAVKKAPQRASKKAPREKIKKVPRTNAGAGRSLASPFVMEQPPASDPVRLLAVIDVGSAALRMAIGEARQGAPIRRLETLEAPVAVGLDTLSQGRIQSVTTETAIRTFHDFFVVLDGYGISPESCRAVATTAVRDARNRDVFLDRVEKACGLRIQVIEAIEELRLNYQLVRRTLGPRFDRGRHMLLSLGSGGTQVVVQHDGMIVFEETLHFGMLKLQDLTRGRWPQVAAVRGFLGKVVGAVNRLQDLTGVTSLVVISSEIHQLVDRLARVKHTTAGLEITRRSLESLHRDLGKLAMDEVLQRVGLDYATVDKGLVALEELWAFTRATAARTIIVPSVSMLDSLLLDARLRGEQHGEEDLAQQIEYAAMALGRRYHYDEAHELQVRKLALQLFDDLQQLTNLSPRSRLMLSVAAILHDVGYYVSPRGHEQHSRYLISSSEIMGFTRDELQRIALVAGYHKRPMRSLSDERLARLPSAERVEVLKLAALLRLAEALDPHHQQRVNRVTARIKPASLSVLAETRFGDRDDFTIIADSFHKKSDLFEEIFGIKPTLTEVLAS